MQSSKPISKLYYYEFPLTEGRNGWELTFDKRLAAKGLNFRDAELDDLNSYGAIGKIIVDKILHIAEGLFCWDSVAISDGFNTYGEYVLVDDIKECVLDRLEDLGLSNSVMYEQIISYSSWQVHSNLDQNDYQGILG